MELRGDDIEPAPGAPTLDERWQQVGEKLRRKAPRAYEALIAAFELLLADLAESSR